MISKIKYGKIAIIIFLTVLIWVWADLQETEVFPDSSATITVAQSTNPGLWVSFGDKLSVSIKKVALKGSASKIAEVKRKLREGELDLEFYLDPEQLAEKAGPDKYPLDVLDFLKKSDKIRQLGLTVESCDPNTLDVQITKLVKKLLAIECVDENQISLKIESIEPSEVEMFVPEDWSGGKLLARVKFSRAEEQQARRLIIPKKPYIQLAPNQVRYAATSVKIKLLPAEEKLKEYNITSATIGLILSTNLVGKCNIELLNQPEMAIVSIMATSAAKSAYEHQPHQMLLYVLDDDQHITTEQKRKVVYNFPEEFVRNNEIELKGQPVEARFKLVPLAAEISSSLVR